jgi:hypothetical protein
MLETETGFEAACISIIPKTMENMQHNACTKNKPFSHTFKRVKVQFSIEQAMKAQRGSRGIALFFL